MNRITFDKLKIEEQINYINNALQNKITLTNICKNIGIARSTVRERALKNGYAYDDTLNQYICDNDKTNESRDNSKLNIIHNSANSNNNDISKSFVSNKKLMKNLVDLSDNYEKIINVLNWFENDRNKTNVIEVVQGIKIELPEEKNKEFRKTIRINDVVWEQFSEFCTNHREFTQKDLLSQALLEYIKSNNSN